MSTDLERLGAAQYLLLTTFRRDGTAVPTPVWVARDGAELVVFTAPNAGKVKRIRRDGAVRVGPCTMRGLTSPTRRCRGVRGCWIARGWIVRWV